MCEYVCVVAVWCSGYVLGSGPEVLKFKPRSGNVHLIFHLPLTSPPPPPPPPPLPTSPPSCDGDGYLVFAGVQIQGFFSCNSNGPGGTWVPTPLPVRKGLFSCEFLAHSSRSFACTAHIACLGMCDHLAAARETNKFLAIKTSLQQL